MEIPTMLTTEQAVKILDDLIAQIALNRDQRKTVEGALSLLCEEAMKAKENKNAGC